jgi:isopenicillin N synthase-like dioxygenase
MKVPLIDLQLPSRRLSRLIDEAGRGPGTFALTGHGVPLKLLRETQAASREFFALPDVQKRRVAAPPTGILRGWFPVGAEALSYSRGVAGRPDLNESFMIGPLRGGAAPNRWPAAPRGFRGTWTRYYRAMEGVSARLLEVFATALDLPEDFFAAPFAGHEARLRARFYPAQPSAPRAAQTRLGAHTDYIAMTLLLTEDKPGGLQVRNGRNWADVRPEPGRLIVNVGDLLERWTNGRWRAVLHRVANPPRAYARESRLSLAYFHSPNDKAVVAPVDTCLVPGRAPRFEPVKAGDYVRGRLRAARKGA